LLDACCLTDKRKKFEVKLNLAHGERRGTQGRKAVPRTFYALRDREAKREGRWWLVKEGRGYYTGIPK